MLKSAFIELVALVNADKTLKKIAELHGKFGLEGEISYVDKPLDIGRNDLPPELAYMYQHLMIADDSYLADSDNSQIILFPVNSSAREEYADGWNEDPAKSFYFASNDNDDGIMCLNDGSKNRVVGKNVDTFEEHPLANSLDVLTGEVS